MHFIKFCNKNTVSQQSMMHMFWIKSTHKTTLKDLSFYTKSLHVSVFDCLSYLSNLCIFSLADNIKPFFFHLFLLLYDSAFLFFFFFLFSITIGSTGRPNHYNTPKGCCCFTLTKWRKADQVAESRITIKCEANSTVKEHSSLEATNILW